MQKRGPGLCRFPGASAEMLVVDAPAHGVVAKTYADQRLDVVTTSDIQATDLADAHEAFARDTAIVLFSSGSVSAPKGVLLTNANVACQLAAAESKGSYRSRNYKTC